MPIIRLFAASCCSSTAYRVSEKAVGSLVTEYKHVPPLVLPDHPTRFGREICEEIGWDTDRTPGSQVNPHAQSVHTCQQSSIGHPPNGVMTRGGGTLDVGNPRRDLQLIVQCGGHQVFESDGGAG